MFTDFLGPGDDIGRAVAVQPDGKIVVAGLAGQDGTDYDFGLVRYNVDGSLDAGFGLGGKLTTDFGLSDDNGICVALQSDGKIVVGGYTRANANEDYDLAVARYNADGSLDAGFGTGGNVITAITSNDDFARGIAIQSNGKILLAGNSGVVRYNVDGTLDNSFGTGGIVSAVGGNSLALQSDGKILVAGSAYRQGSTGSDFLLARLNVNGSLDTSFDKDGKVTTDFRRSADLAWDVAVQGNGRIVVAGFATTSTGTDFALARYHTNGSLDTSFGSSGKVMTDFGLSLKYDEIRGIAIQADGKLVAAGTTSSGIDSALARYNANGTLDASFGTGGKVIADLGSPDAASSVTLQSDGKIIVAGYAAPPGASTNTDFLVARFLGDSAALMSASSGLVESVSQTLTLEETNPLLAQAIARWRTGGVDTSSLHGIDIRIANLGGTTLGLTSGHTIWLDDNAAGWGWFVDATPRDDYEFTTPGNQGEQGHMDLLTVIAHELGHLLGYDHSDNGVMDDTLDTGVRAMPVMENVFTEPVVVDSILALDWSERHHAAATSCSKP